MPEITKEQYAELLSALERASWYFKCAVEKLERYLPPPPAAVVKPEICADCKKLPALRGDIYCGACVGEHRPLDIP